MKKVRPENERLNFWQETGVHKKSTGSTLPALGLNILAVK
jgi:hypothetical protein